MPSVKLDDQESPSAGRYLAQGVNCGCSREQVLRFLSSGIILQPRQLLASAAARSCDTHGGPSEIGYGGARGGGKSYWLLAQMGADDCQRVPGLKCLLLRKVGKANLEHLDDLRRSLFRNIPHEFTAHRGILTFPNGSRIVCGHFQTEGDVEAYLGLEYDIIGIEEATTLSHTKFEHIRTCNRSSKRFGPSGHWRPRIYSTTNPGGIGHAWYRARYILPDPPTPECPTGYLKPPGPNSSPSTIIYKPSTTFIPAKALDNRCLNPEYITTLQKLHGWQRRAWLDGDWDIAAGQFFTTFSRAHHVIDDSKLPFGSLNSSSTHYPLSTTHSPSEWFAAMDYGFTHYTVVLLGCRDGDGNIFVVDEHAERGWLPERHAEAIHTMLARYNLTTGLYSPFSSSGSIHYPLSTTHSTNRLLTRFVAGTDVFAKSESASIADQYRKLGIRLQPANMNRINGWAEILSRLGDPASARPSAPSTINDQPSTSLAPRLFIHQRCARLIETLPMLQHDPSRPEDVLKVDTDESGLGGDDAADALRYLVASKPKEVAIIVA